MSHVIITCPKKRALRLEPLLQRAGLTTQVLPLVETEPLTSELCDLCSHYLFVSPSAVEHGVAQLDRHDLAWRRAQIWAIGSSTAKALKPYTTEVLYPTPASIDGLLADNRLELDTNQHWAIVKGKGGRQDFIEHLRQHSIPCEVVDVYQRRCPQQDFDMKGYGEAGSLVIITSQQALDYLLAKACGCDALKSSYIYVVVSQRIADYALSLGCQQVRVTDGPYDDQILQTVLGEGHGKSR